METCLLIPECLSLVLRPAPSVARGGLLEMGATIWASEVLPPGTLLRPDAGKVRLDTLEVYGHLTPEDVRQKFGLFDEFHEVEETEVRHCNWVRFVQSAPSLTEANIVAQKIEGEPLYRVIRPVYPNQELKVYFELAKTEPGRPLPDAAIMAAKDSPSPEVKQEVQDGPRPSVSTPIKTPDSPRSPGTRSLFTSPSDPDDDSKSVNSDASEESHHSAKSGASGNMSFGHDGRPQAGLTPLIPSPNHGISHSARLLSAGMGLLSSTFGLSPQPRGPGSDLDLSSTPARLPVRRNRERTWLPCEVCGKKFDRPSLLRRHMRTHTGEKPHACDVCGKAFSTSSSLNTHRRIHSGEKPHVCNVCGKRFTASSNLYYHRMTHNKEKPHKCTLCAKSFPTPGDLKSHMYVHNGSWPFKCDVCNRGFSKQTNLKNHMLLHTGDKPHECNLCGKRFALQCNLKTHVKTHEGEPQEECFKCGTSFLTASNQVINGYCRSCLARAAPGRRGTSPGDRSTNYSIESLAKSSFATKSPPDSIAMGPSRHIDPRLDRHMMDSPQALAMSGYAMLNAAHAHSMGMPALPVPMPHPASGLLPYPGSLSWSKLVPQHY